MNRNRKNSADYAKKLAEQILEEEAYAAEMHFDRLQDEYQNNRHTNTTYKKNAWPSPGV
jgi:hypothetical protein